MTLYRINVETKSVEVLMESKWQELPGGEDDILVRELNPQPIGYDGEFRYLRTDEPGDDGPVEVTIRGLQRRSHKISIEKGWWTKQDGSGEMVGEEVVGEKIALIHSEVSEALEEWRKPNVGLAEIYYVEKDGEQKPEGFPVELADAMIRIAELAERFGVDLTRALLIKEAYNRTRPHRHRGKRA